MSSSGTTRQPQHLRTHPKLRRSDCLDQSARLDPQRISSPLSPLTRRMSLPRPTTPQQGCPRHHSSAGLHAVLPGEACGASPGRRKRTDRNTRLKSPAHAPGQPLGIATATQMTGNVFRLCSVGHSRAPHSLSPLRRQTNRPDECVSGCANEAIVRDESEALNVFLAGIGTWFREEYTALVQAIGCTAPRRRRKRARLKRCAAR